MCRVGGDGHRNLCRSRVELKERTFALAKTQNSFIRNVIQVERRARVYPESISHKNRKERQVDCQSPGRV